VFLFGFFEWMCGVVFWIFEFVGGCLGYIFNFGYGVLLEIDFVDLRCFVEFVYE